MASRVEGIREDCRTTRDRSLRQSRLRKYRRVAWMPRRWEMSDRGLLAAVDVFRDIDRYSAQVVANDSNSATSCPQLAEEGESLGLAEGIRRQVAITVQRGARRVVRVGVVIRIRVPLTAIEAQVVPTNRLAGLSQVSGQFGRS